MELTEAQMDKRIEQETSALEREASGEAAITVGKALLGMDLILACFVQIGFRTGSRLFLWWVLAEGVLGLALAVIGLCQKMKANKQLDVLALKGTRAAQS